MVSDLWRVLVKIDTPCLHFVCWHLQPFGRSQTYAPMNSVSKFCELGCSKSLRCCSQFAGGGLVYIGKMRTVLGFKDHFLSDSL